MTEISMLKSIVETLRSENGCSWDKVQTHSSLKAACIEEAAEVVGGINILEKTGDAVPMIITRRRKNVPLSRGASRSFFRTFQPTI